MSQRMERDAPEDVFARLKVLRDFDNVLYRVTVPVHSFAAGTWRWESRALLVAARDH